MLNLSSLFGKMTGNLAVQVLNNGYSMVVLIYFKIKPSFETVSFQEKN